MAKVKLNPGEAVPLNGDWVEVVKIEGLSFLAYPTLVVDGHEYPCRLGTRVVAPFSRVEIRETQLGYGGTVTLEFGRGDVTRPRPVRTVQYGPTESVAGTVALATGVPAGASMSEPFIPGATNQNRTAVFTADPTNTNNVWLTHSAGTTTGGILLVPGAQVVVPDPGTLIAHGTTGDFLYTYFSYHNLPLEDF